MPPIGLRGSGRASVGGFCLPADGPTTCASAKTRTAWKLMQKTVGPPLPATIVACSRAMKRTLVLLALLFAPAAANAQLIPRKILFGNPEKAGPQISPDGKLLAYLAPEKGVLNVWVLTLGKDDARVVTSDKKRGVRQYFWQP